MLLKSSNEEEYQEDFELLEFAWILKIRRINPMNLYILLTLTQQIS